MPMKKRKLSGKVINLMQQTNAAISNAIIRREALTEIRFLWTIKFFKWSEEKIKLTIIENIKMDIHDEKTPCWCNPWSLSWFNPLVPTIKKAIHTKTYINPNIHFFADSFINCVTLLNEI
ncbi:MAG: hypothetical protein FWB96_02000 [Defluviitaleaceae bacterium]|nr:hypothetical protein [Defluviitaleaceae bacterium]MCL2262017.1 hypothetical protein [Defluviitaleaceae bacterium]